MNDVTRAGELARALALQSKAPNTRRAYQRDWAAFVAYCLFLQWDPLPATPRMAVLYVEHLVKLQLSPATVQRYLSTVSTAHAMAGLPDPCRDPAVRAVVAGHRRTVGVRQRQVAAITTPILARMVAVLEESPIDTRDRALLLVGFAAALRRSELVALTWSDIQWLPDGIRVLIRRSKGDQEGAGVELDIPHGRAAGTCPVRALVCWRGLVESVDWAHGDGPAEVFLHLHRGGGLFGGPLSPVDVARRIQEVAARAGLDPREYSGHSLRAGFATSAAAAGVDALEIAGHTRHQNVNTLKRYVRAARSPRSSVAGKVGL